MAVRTPAGQTFPGNFAIIPSSKKWVFHAIFRLAFFELYGDEVCSMNRLVLTDEEDAEYRSFESLIATNDIFKKSKVMLCIFHAVLQHKIRSIRNCTVHNMVLYGGKRTAKKQRAQKVHV